MSLIKPHNIAINRANRVKTNAMSVLLVEDQVNLNSRLTKALMDFGYQVIQHQ